MQRSTSPGIVAAQVLTSLALLASLVGPLDAQVGAIDWVHDPAIAKSGDTYYLISSGVHAGEMAFLRTSKDLYRWQLVGEIIPELPAWTSAIAPRDGNIWAPDISFFGGEHRLYYAVSSFGTNKSAIGLLSSKSLDPASPDYHWIDRGKVIESRPGTDDWNAIDPNVAFDEAGAPWLVFGSYWTGIKMRKLDAATGRLSASDGTLYALASRPGVTSIEAPFIVRAKGRFYLFVSFDQCCVGAQSEYKIYAGRSTGIKGPYRDREGDDMMQGGGTLVLKGYGKYRGPGHNAVLQDGSRWWLVHHYYDADQNGLPKLHVRPLYWASDGWPLAGEPLTAPPQDPVEPYPVGTWEHSVDFEPGGTIKLFSNGRTLSPAAQETWSLSGSELTLRWPNPAAPGGVWIDGCVLAADGRSYVGRNQIGVIVRGKRVPAKFVRGDGNGDGVVDLSDAVFALSYLFQGSAVLSCLKAIDANDDGVVDIADPIYALGYLFGGGPRIPPPQAPGGLDTTADDLGC